MQGYSNSVRESRPPSIQLGEVFALEVEARKFGELELLDIAERIKNAHGWLLRGECVPPNELRELIAFVRRNTEPAVAEVAGA
jgi:hypothetical protein